MKVKCCRADTLVVSLLHRLVTLITNIIVFRKKQNFWIWATSMSVVLILMMGTRANLPLSSPSTLSSWES